MGQRPPSISAPSKVKSPTKPQFPAKFTIPPRPDLIYQEQSVEDYSDLLADDDHVFSRGLRNGAKKVSMRGDTGLDERTPCGTESTHHGLDKFQSDAPQLFHPSDLTSYPRSTQGSVGGSMRRQSKPRPSVLPDRSMRRTRSSIEIQKFAEDEQDEDFTEMFNTHLRLAEKEESDGAGSEDGGGVMGRGSSSGLMVLSKLSSHNSWLGDDEDEDDPFASLDPGFDEMDLDANIARDRHARLCEKVEELVRALGGAAGEEDALSDVADELLGLLLASPDVKDLIIGAHGLLPILEILEPCTLKSRQRMILQFLRIVNAVSRRKHKSLASSYPAGG